MIVTENLSRSFGEIKAVDGISFSAGKGEVLGFLGPNGAGKSTTMKMLTCFLTPSGGKATVAGYDTIEQSIEVRKQIGYLPENAPLYGEMEVLSFLRFIAEVRGMEPKAISSAVDRVLTLTSLTSVTRQRIETLSKGFKRRVGLAQALIHDPAILILDEPTDGLDPNQKFEVRKLISSMGREKCIVLSTHILEEVDAVCTRAVIIAKGKIVADGDPVELRKKSRRYGAVTISIRGGNTGEIRKALQTVGGVREILETPLSGGRTSMTVIPSDGRMLIAEIVKTAEKSKWPLEDIRLESGELDEVFREITH